MRQLRFPAFFANPIGFWQDSLMKLGVRLLVREISKTLIDVGCWGKHCRSLPSYITTDEVSSLREVTRPLVCWSTSGATVPC